MTARARTRGPRPWTASTSSRRCPGPGPSDPATACAAMRKDLIPYFGLPFYRAMIERSGFDADIAAYDAAAGDLEAMQAAISDASSKS